jgi:hypothetical protein
MSIARPVTNQTLRSTAPSAGYSYPRQYAGPVSDVTDRLSHRNQVEKKLGAKQPGCQQVLWSGQHSDNKGHPARRGLKRARNKIFKLPYCVDKCRWHGDLLSNLRMPLAEIALISRRFTIDPSRYRAAVSARKGNEMKIDTGVRHVTKPGANLF